jgi:acetyl-CoA acyltransferase
MQEAYIVAGLRTAVGKAPRGLFRFTRPDDLAVEVIRQLLLKVPQLDPARVEDLIVGNAVPEAEQGITNWSYDCRSCVAINYRWNDRQ